jgi:hypothetical protein
MVKGDYEVELQISEVVTRGGVRRVTWLLDKEDEWISVAKLPGVELERGDRGPGMVWLCRVRLQLPLGARLMRVESQPQRGEPKDPLAYFWSARSSAQKRVDRSYFQVGDQGRLIRIHKPEQ